MTITSHHVRLISTYKFSSFKMKVLSAEAPEREVDISPEKLHTVVKDQGKYDPAILESV